MTSIVDVLKGKEAFSSLNGATKDNIADAENELGVKFTDEYIEYVSALGAVSYYGHELTGVCKAKALDVVGITISEREYAEVPQDWYVIEQAHIDGIVFWQAHDGKIYQTAGKARAKKVFNSLIEYVSND